jgi:hypothetical protein
VTLPLGSVGYQAEANERVERLIRDHGRRGLQGGSRVRACERPHGARIIGVSAMATRRTALLGSPCASTSRRTSRLLAETYRGVTGRSVRGLTIPKRRPKPCYACRKAQEGKCMEPMDLVADTRRYLADAIRQLEVINAGAPIAKPLTREQAINIVTEQIGLFESVLRRYGGGENANRT